MSTRVPIVHVQFAGQDVALRFRHSIPVSLGAEPGRASLPLRCAICNLWCSAEGAVVLTYVDDDHYAYTDVGYEARPATACRSCGSPLQVALRFTLTHHRGDPEHPQFEWDGVRGSVDGVA